ncbi:hypothetical protein GPALN_013178 [Globodera pallida]|nr:hypothetical protein GPALN_013178 [Globodera pallida]
MKNFLFVFYYEVKIIGKGDGVHIGLATKQVPLASWVGHYKGTYAYERCGRLWGHADVLNGKPHFGGGDVIGCGVDLATRQIISQRMASVWKLPGCLLPILPPPCFRALRCYALATRLKPTLDRTLNSNSDEKEAPGQRKTIF